MKSLHAACFHSRGHPSGYSYCCSREIAKLPLVDVVYCSPSKTEQTWGHTHLDRRTTEAQLYVSLEKFQLIEDVTQNWIQRTFCPEVAVTVKWLVRSPRCENIPGLGLGVFLCTVYMLSCSGEISPKVQKHVFQD